MKKISSVAGAIKFFLLCSVFVFFYTNGQPQNVEPVYGINGYNDSVIFVITNRVIDVSEGVPIFNAAITVDTSLSYIRVTVGKLMSPKYEFLDIKSFLSHITSQQKDWLLFVHGDSKTFDDAVMSGLDIQNYHDIKVIVFSWPSKDENITGHKNFKNSQENVKKSVFHFAKLLDIISYLRKDDIFINKSCKLSLCLHSLGNSYLENLVVRNLLPEQPAPVFDNVIINAAAVNQLNHRSWVEKLNFQKNIYITCNQHDFNLKGARIFTKDGKQLGEKIKSPLASNASYIHFTKAIGFRFPTGTTHTYFVGSMTDKSENIRHFYYSIFHGSTPDLKDGAKFTKRKDNLGYDINSNK